MGVVVSLGLAEGLTRPLFPAFDPSGRFEFAHPMGYLLLGKPGTEARQVVSTGDYDVSVRVNSHGLRDAHGVATAGSDDIPVVGGSFAWSWGVEVQDRFSDQLPRRPADLQSFDAHRYRIDVLDLEPVLEAQGDPLS